MKTLKNVLLGLLLGACIVGTAIAGKPSGGGGGGGTWPGGTLFTFNYNVGTTVTNYHAYVTAGQVGTIPQPANTVILIHWYVLDKGPVSGTGTVTVPAEKLYSTGILLFANANDVGGDGGSDNEHNTNPIAMVEVGSGKSGFSNIQIALPHMLVCDTNGMNCYVKTPGIYVENGIPYTSWGWDLSPYLWNVMPADVLAQYYQY